MGIDIENNILIEIGRQIKGDLFNRSRIHKITLEALNKQPERFNAFKEVIAKMWNDFKKDNEKRKFKYKYTTFFDKNFDYIIKAFIVDFLGYNVDNLKQISSESVTDNDLYLEYIHNFSDFEIKLLHFIKKFLNHPLEFDRIVPFLFDIMIQILGMIIRDIINQEIWISQRGARLKKEGDKYSIHFLITIRRSPDELMNSYFDFILYNFTLKYSQIPDSIKEDLLKKKNRLTKIALENYFSSRENLVDIIYNFYKKCTLLGTVSPFLDFLNFVCSRIEDSKFDTNEVIRDDFLVNLGYSSEVKEALMRLFDFINRYSSLFCTFQANNRPAFQEQYNLFLLYLQFFFGRGIEALEIGDLIYFPEKFSKRVEDYNLEKKYKITSKTIRTIGFFSNISFSLSKLPDTKYFFTKIFKKNISRINEDFFISFLNSFNKKFKIKIEEENVKLKKSKNFISFEKAVDFICRSIYTLINSVFLRDSLDEASRNFIDPRSRYIPENVALRVLELSIFKELNLSDDIWDDYMLSIKKEQVLDLFGEYIQLPNDMFYSNWDLSMLDMIYNQEIFNEGNYLEDFLISDIVTPLNKFIRKFHEASENSANKSEMIQKLMIYFADDTDDKQKLTNLETILDILIEGWDIEI